MAKSKPKKVVLKPEDILVEYVERLVTVLRYQLPDEHYLT